MSRTLPPRPDFTQLKHQAKDLLRAHGRKDASACSILRNLRQFADASDADILAKPLALHEAQFALAMEYGFASWNAMKRHVEHVTGRPLPVRREKGRTYVTGLETHPIGGDGEHENSVIAAIAGVMAAMGEDELTYEYLMGASGAAFRVQMAEPAWCPSAACAPCGYDCVPGALKVTGYRAKWVQTQREGKWLDEGVKEALQAVADSVERGVPVIAAGEETGLIVGYHADGKLMARPYPSMSEGYLDIEVFAPDGAVKWSFGDGSGGQWVWSVGVLEPEELPADRRQAVEESLRLAVTLAETERFGPYLSGFAALEYWIAGLEDESRFAELTEQNWFVPALANGYCYGCLWATRKTAQKYLQSVADDFAEPIRSKLLEVAGLYGQMDRTLGRKRPEYACAWSLMPWKLGGLDKWTSRMRQVQAETLREVLTLERQAVAGIAEVLSILDA